MQLCSFRIQLLSDEFYNYSYTSFFQKFSKLSLSTHYYKDKDFYYPFISLHLSWHFSLLTVHFCHNLWSEFITTGSFISHLLAHLLRTFPESHALLVIRHFTKGIVWTLKISCFITYCVKTNLQISLHNILHC